MKKLLTYLYLTLATPVAFAQGVYQQPDDFLAEVFANDVPTPKFVWFTGEIKEQTVKILGHKPAVLRTRYWHKNSRTAWILEEIGKEKPITTGYVINKNKIEKVKVLIFRESRGWEVKRDAFTDQFTDATLKDNSKLSKSIDGISGATLSVDALTRLAQLALYLHQQVTKKNESP